MQGDVEFWGGQSVQAMAGFDLARLVTKKQCV